MDGQHQVDCTQFEALLSEALDGTLSQPTLAEFRKHVAACADCGPMFSAAEAGMHWLQALPEVEPPRNLVRNILIATSGAEARVPARQAATSPWKERVLDWARPLAPVFATIRQPRFALSLGMAFFSITVLLNAAGLHVSSLRASDLRPSSIQENLARTYNETTGRAVKYYENLRFVYEIESRVREIRNATREEDRHEERRQPEKNDQKYRDDNRSGKPDPGEERYSRRDEPMVLAGGSLEEHAFEPATPVVPRRAA